MKRLQLSELIQRALRKAGYKDYLTSREEHEVLKIDKLLDVLEGVLNDFKSKGNITPFEHKNLKTGVTVISKYMYSILKRQSYDSYENIRRKSEKLILYVVDRVEHDRMKKEIDSTLETSENIRESLLDLCGAAMELNCEGCTKESKNCVLYHQFVRNHVAEPTGEHFENKRCKYSYLGL